MSRLTRRNCLQALGVLMLWPWTLPRTRRRSSPWKRGKWIDGRREWVRQDDITAIVPPEPWQDLMDSVGTVNTRPYHGAPAGTLHVTTITCDVYPTYRDPPEPRWRHVRTVELRERKKKWELTKLGTRRYRPIDFAEAFDYA